MDFAKKGTQALGGLGDGEDFRKSPCVEDMEETSDLTWSRQATGFYYSVIIDSTFFCVNSETI